MCARGGLECTSRAKRVRIQVEAKGLECNQDGHMADCGGIWTGTARTVEPFKRLHETETAGSKLEFQWGGPIRLLTVRSRLSTSRGPSVTQSVEKVGCTSAVPYWICKVRFIASQQAKYFSRTLEREAEKGAKTNSSDQSITGSPVLNVSRCSRGGIVLFTRLVEPTRRAITGWTPVPITAQVLPYRFLVFTFYLNHDGQASTTKGP